MENTDYTDFLRRAIRALGRRVADGDVDGLAELDGLHKVIDDAMLEAVKGLRAEPHAQSWSRIGSTLGITYQAAMQRWPNAGGARRPGGQPAHLR